MAQRVYTSTHKIVQGAMPFDSEVYFRERDSPEWLKGTTREHQPYRSFIPFVFSLGAGNSARFETIP